ncbi:MAG: AMP-binding protein [Oscillospiraceae bacterium]|nr:AMP-binding protein [Oscillospiraceae bacterium]
MKTPWYSVAGDTPTTLDYPDCTMFEAVEACAEKYPDHIAYDFTGKRTSYSRALDDICECARSLRAIGIREYDRVTICLPNTPQAVTMFYAINMIGAVANMIHPLSSENEIKFYLNDSKSVAAITLDLFYGKFSSVIKSTPCLKSLIITSVKDALSRVMKLGYKFTEGRKITPLPRDADIILWRDFLKAGSSLTEDPRIRHKKTDPAVILYSGGTTGITKGILLSNLNFNALGCQVVAANPIFGPGDKMLAIMPMFHGFGLGVSIHAMLIHGGRCILVPRFTASTYADLLRKHKPGFIAGVPTLYEALLRIEGIDDLDLSCLKGVFSGGDSLSTELKKRFDAFLRAHNASVLLREGYGTTECVTASCLTPPHTSREGSIGIPLPDTFYKIVKTGTVDEVPYGAEGEICICGPTVMLEYAGRPEETAKTLRKHADGLTWLHTGDLGVMDQDGFVYFRQRLKRLIITSGYNVYPSQLENILDANKYVHISCVIGVKDPYKIQKVKAFIVLKPGYLPSDDIREELLRYCEKNMAKHAVPSDIEFRDDLPKTLVGKVAYRMLEEEELSKASA